MAYIDKEKFLKKSVECFGHFGVLVKAIEEVSNECTEEDVVEVVRCKDCKYWAEETDFGMFCSHWGSTLSESQADDFCSYGTPKERGGEK